jgi:2-methylisocitrate lyase-like PEP mutase family enzyme
MTTPASATRAQKVDQLFRLHQGPGAFVIANAWDASSARVLAGLGFRALATSSGAAANTLGRRDGQISRDEALAHARAIVEAIDLPVSADLENCFAADAAGAAQTIRLAADAGLAGGSIEDSTGNRDAPIFDVALAVERVAAAAEAAHSAPGSFVLTARTEIFLHGRTDIDEAVQRLQAYEKAGADVLMAPALPSLDAVRTVCRALKKPFNFMAGIPGKSFTVAELADAGARRVSVATSLYRAAMSGLIDAAAEVANSGSFTYLDRLRPSGEMLKLMKI